MGNVNKVLLMGNLTRDVETRNAGSSTVASFGLAVNERYKDRNDQWVERVNFIDCECWGNRGEAIARYLGKGDPIFVEGKLQLDQWQDQQGNNRSKLKVVVTDFQFIGGRDNGGNSSGGHRQPQTQPAVSDDDIPF